MFWGKYFFYLNLSYYYKAIKGRVNEETLFPLSRSSTAISVIIAAKERKETKRKNLSKYLNTILYLSPGLSPINQHTACRLLVFRSGAWYG